MFEWQHTETVQKFPHVKFFQKPDDAKAMPLTKDSSLQRDIIAGELWRFYLPGAFRL